MRDTYTIYLLPISTRRTPVGRNGSSFDCCNSSQSPKVSSRHVIIIATNIEIIQGTNNIAQSIVGIVIQVDTAIASATNAIVED